MVVYSTVPKPIKDKAIPSLVGGTIIILAGDKYIIQRKCTKEQLENVHTFGKPFVVAEKIIKNEIKVKGAVNPMYAVLESKATLVIGKQTIVPITHYSDIDGVSYSNVSWNLPPAKKGKTYLPANDNKYDKYNTDEQELLSMFTQEFKHTFATWNPTKKRWEWNTSKMEVIEYRYPDMFITREGMLNFKNRPQYENNDLLTNGETDRTDIDIISAHLRNEIEEIKKMIKEFGVKDSIEKYEYKYQMQACWLLIVISMALHKAKKDVSYDNLCCVIGDIREAYDVPRYNGLLFYLYSYAKDISKLV